MSLSWTSQPGTITEGSPAAVGDIISSDPSVSVSGIPVGATLTDGTNVFIASGGTTSVSITGWINSGGNWSDLTLAAPAEASFTLTVANSGTSVADTITVIDPLPTLQVAVSGYAGLGDTLTAVPAGTNAGDETVTYQWQSESATGGVAWSDISGATGVTYTTQVGDEGDVLRVLAVASDSGGNVNATSDPTATVTIDPAPTLTVTVSGTAVAGHTLTASPAGTNAGDETVTYQWQNASDGTTWSNISGATGVTYTAQVGDEGDVLRVVATGTDSGGSAASTSDPTATVTTDPVPTLTVSLGGSSVVGQSLTATPSGTNASDESVAYQWQNSSDGTTWSNIASATAATYTAQASDENDMLRVTATGSDSGGTTATTSGPSGMVTDPVPALSVKVNGNAVVGRTLNGVPSATNAGDETVSYQWQSSADGGTWTNISAATGVSYSVQAGDENDFLRVIATGTDSGGTVPATSAASAKVTDPAPALSVTVSGSAVVAQTLTAAPSATNAADETVTYQWQTSSNGSVWNNIAGATATTYTAQAGDENDFLRVTATGADSGGSVGATSAASAKVTDPAPTLTVSVSGGAVVGHTLTATPTGTNAADETVSYQWQNSSIAGTWNDIPGATASTYTAQATDENDLLRVTVTGTDSGGTVPASSAPSAKVTDPTPTLTVSLSGAATVGQTLTAAASGTNAGDETISYQWQTSSNGTTWTPIGGATTATYTAQAGDENDFLRVTASGTDSGGTVGASSAASAKVTDPAPTLTVSLSGSAAVGQTLTATPSGTNAADETVTYQWQNSSNGSTWNSIPGATAATYTEQVSDEGDVLRVIASGTDSGGTVAATSAPASTVLDPAPTLGVSLGGTASVGQTLTATASGTNAADETVTYQWQNSTNGSAWSTISGATAATYTAQAGDENDFLRVTAAGTDSGGTASASSGPSAKVTDPTPTLTVAVSGTAVVGQTLTATPSGTNAADETVTYQWQNSTNGSAWNAISGATAATYTAQTGDENDFLRVTAAGTDSGGTAAASSGPSAKVTDPAPTITVSASGSAVVGQTLTAAASGTNAADETVTYQWQNSSNGSAWTPIAGATAATYTAKSSDESDFLRVVASGADSGGTVAASSGASAKVTDPAPTLTVSVSGSAVVGQTLTAAASGTNAADETVTYQWQNSTNGTTWTTIAGATAATYTAKSSDENDFLRVTATGADSGGSAAASSGASAKVTDPAPTLTVTLSGAAVAGQTLTATPSGTNAADETITYHWQNSTNGTAWSNISGATVATYTVQAGDENDFLRVTATGTDSGGTVGATSGASLKVTDAAPTLTVSITGIAVIGQTLTAAPSGTNAADETVTYQWQNSTNGSTWSDISGATAATYTAQTGDENDFLRVTATGADSGGSVGASSGPSAKVTDPAPALSVSVGGSAVVGQTLTASASGTSAADETVTYQWQNSSNGTAWNTIAGATAATYTAQAADENDFLRVTATGTDSGGAVGASSGPSAKVTDPAPTLSVSIGGGAVVGQTLTAAPSGTSAADETVTYQWQNSTNASAWNSIAGATAATYTAQAGDENDFLRVIATGTDSGGAAGASSAASAKVTDPAPTLTVSIGGGAVVGQTLTATPSGTNAADETVTYQWQNSSNGSAWTTIAGATAATYTAQASDENDFVRVTATGTDSGGTIGATSGASSTVTDPAPTLAVSITGYAQVGQSLTAAPSGTNAADETVSTQWQNSTNGTNWNDISGATGITYTEQSGDAGHVVRVIATGTDSGGSVAATSAPASTVLDPAPTLTVSVSGSAVVGQTLTATPSGTNAGDESVSYQWQNSSTGASWNTIAGATAATYTAQASDENDFLRVSATGADSGGSIVATDGPPAKVTDPAPTLSIAVSGTAVVGQTLTAAASGTSAADETVTFQWQNSSNGTSWNTIAGATAATYTAQAADENDFLRVSVTGIDSGGAVSVSSGASARVTDPAPTLTIAVSGSALVGQTLTATPSGTNAADETVTFQWQNSSNGSTWTNIAGATAATYTAHAADENDFLRVTATGVDSGGAAGASSGPSAKVTDPAPTLSVSIGGSAVVGQTLTGTVSGTNAADETVAYQWQNSSNGTSWNTIAGATGTTYTAQAADENDFLRVTATGADSGGAAGASSGSSAKVTDPAPTLTVSVSGSTVVGQTLSATLAGTNAADETVTYQWQNSSDGASWNTIALATGITYTAQASDENDLLRVVATGTDSGGSVGTTTGPAAKVTDPAPTLTVAVSGSAVVGQTLSAVPSGTNAGDETVTYQWQNSSNGSGWNNIAGATAATYTAQASDENDVLRVVAAGADSGGSVGTTTGPTGKVTDQAPTLTVSVSGTAVVGQTLTATPTGTNAADETVTYQWQNSSNGSFWNNISSATAATYTAQAGDENDFLRVVAAGNSSGGAVGASSGPTAKVTDPAPALTVAVAGGAVVGQTLTAVPSGTNAVDETVTYQWQNSSNGSSWNNISSATAATYTAQAGDENDVLRVIATGTDSGGTVGTTSLPSPKVTDPAPTLTVSISGGAVVGQTLTAIPSGTNAADETVTYQWQSSSGNGWSNIAGATTATYTAQAGDENDLLRVIATGADSGGSIGTTTGPTAKVTDPAPTLDVSVGGTAVVGQTLTATASGTDAADETVTYQWQNSSNGASWNTIAGATAATYTVKSSDENDFLRVIAAGADSGGVIVAPSGPSAKVTDPAPSLIVTVSGATVVGQTLTATPSATNATDETVTYQWQTSSNGSSWSNIAGATAATYTAQASDENDFLRVSATGADSGGSIVVTNGPAGKVTDPAPTLSIAVSGTAVVGQTLTATASGTNAADETVTYQWQNSSNGSSWTTIAGATATTYTAQATDENDVLRVTATGADSGGTLAVSSVPSATVLDPVPTLTVSVSGTPLEGETLTATPVTNAADETITYQWQRSSNSGTTWSSISGATGSSYTVAVADGDDLLRVSTTGMDSGGTIAALSNTTYIYGDVVTSLADDGGLGTLRSILTEDQSGKPITFDQSIAGGTIVLASSLLIATNLTINGLDQGHDIVISGGSIFTDVIINSPASVTLENLAIDDGYGTGTNGANGSVGALQTGGAGGNAGGGLFVNGATVSLTNVLFKDDTAIGGNGGNGSPGADMVSASGPKAGQGFGGGAGGNAAGAIYNQHGTLQIGSGVQFIVDSATGGQGGNGGYGGNVNFVQGAIPVIGFGGSYGNGGPAGYAGQAGSGGYNSAGNPVPGSNGGLGGGVGRAGQAGTQATFTNGPGGGGGGGGGGYSYNNYNGLIACFCPGTMLATPDGETAVEALRIGDLVLTGSGAARPVKWIGRRAYAAPMVAANAQLRPVRIRAGALADGLPRRDLLVSPQHAMLVEGVLVPAAALVNGRTILRESVTDTLSYLHVELAEGELILAEGAATESFLDHDSRGLFQNAAQYAVLYPNEQTVAAAPPAPRLTEGFRVATIQRRLARRAGVAEAAQHGRLLGHVEQVEGPTIEGWVIEGWAQDAAHPNRPVAFDIVVDGAPVGRLVANRYRADLDRAGLGGGIGGFRHVLAAQAERITLHRVGDGAILPFAPDVRAAAA